ncbi:MAG TPA: tripartite tricarboxylate transporter TctB family protein [Pseudothermotoga sp.]|mgnify:CR=1 FL=1|nr:tripartite tricarboxylate transporter TctB family protein [Pseudothermotoga sp.]HOK83015.1 tripartite tricarboxylate transporter TctB family protein [Pseudothermotoga sp.]HPP69816.1 tripartite tricarboxylate transporter TctB family protein [Pseudothermotoga sp.]
MKSNIIVSAIFILLAFVFLYQAKDLNYLSAIFPQIVSILLIGFCVALIAVSVRKKSQEKTEKMEKKDLLYIVIVIGLSFIWVYLMDWVFGFTVGSIIFMTIISIIVGGKNIKAVQLFGNIVAYAIIAFAFWYLLAKLLVVPLPRGLLF